MAAQVGERRVQRIPVGILAGGVIADLKIDVDGVRDGGVGIELEPIEETDPESGD